MLTPQLILGLGAKIVVDIFAGGGGWSTAYELATGQHVHVSINHNPAAVSMHTVNHPQARHYTADVREVCPYEATQGRQVGWLHLSPDCTDHSQAKGGQPRSRAIRSLAWMTIRWAGTVKPDIISLENVVQILKWGRLIAKRDPATGRVVTLDLARDAATGRMVNRVADPGERVPVQNQFLVPDPKVAGRNWRRLVTMLRDMGYVVESRVLNAADYGAGTTRKRLFMLARRDGEPIVWPEPTHFKNPAKAQKRWRPAADGIDWSNEGESIFERKRALAEATMRRIAYGMKRYVLNTADPFIVPIANWSRDGMRSAKDSLSTITAQPRGGSHAVVAPILAGVGGRAGQSEPRPADQPGFTTTRKYDTALIAPTLVQVGYGEREGQAPRALDIGQPVGVAPAGGVKHALVTSFLAQANGGFNATPGHDARAPASTITNTGSQQQLITAHLTTLRRNCIGRQMDETVPTITAGAEHHGLVEYQLSPNDEAGALRVAAFLMRYHGSGGQWGDPHNPASTFTTRDRLALVTVYVRGTPYVIVDIKLRMLTPAELYDLQGFPKGYIIDRGHDGRKFTKSEQVHMVGNSVSPPPAIALISANAPQDLFLRKAA